MTRHQVPFRSVISVATGGLTGTLEPLEIRNRPIEADPVHDRALGARANSTSPGSSPGRRSSVAAPAHAFEADVEGGDPDPGHRGCGGDRRRCFGPTWGVVAAVAVGALFGLIGEITYRR